MATIYSAPEGYDAPEMNFKNFNRDEWLKKENGYIARLAEWCRNRNPNDHEYVGKIIRFPVADGYAIYMVASLKPVQLIHVELGDAWHFQYAKNLTKKDVMEEVKRLEALNKLFSKKG